VLVSVVSLVRFLFEIYFWLLLIRIILSWFPVVPRSELSQSLLNFLYEVTEPYLGLFRRILPMVSLGGAGIDFSPIVAIIVLRLIERAVLTLIVFGFRF